MRRQEGGVVAANKGVVGSFGSSLDVRDSVTAYCVLATRGVGCVTNQAIQGAVSLNA
jgi:hypothetical protein